MYAGAVAVPLILGCALKLPPEDVPFLISADLFACGLAKTKAAYEEASAAAAASEHA